MKTPTKENDCSVLKSWESWRLWAAWWLLELIRKNLWSKSCIRAAPLLSPSPGRRGGGGGGPLLIGLTMFFWSPLPQLFLQCPPLYAVSREWSSLHFPWNPCDTHPNPRKIPPPPLGISNPDNKTIKRWALFTWLRGEFRTGTKEKWREHF